MTVLRINAMFYELCKDLSTKEMGFLQEVQNHTQILTQKETESINLGKLIRKNSLRIEKVDCLIDQNARSFPITEIAWNHRISISMKG
ncbi:MAG: hypothetical protein OXF73_12565 [Gammaproteobacteria bacterium]|nr:hypothetical protein [Gammaproteobacteria bacterium]